jgi:hypothetical protein
MQDSKNQDVTTVASIEDNVFPLLSATQTRTNVVASTAKNWMSGEPLAALFQLIKIPRTLLLAPRSARVVGDLKEVAFGTHGQPKTTHRLSSHDAKLSPHPTERISLGNTARLPLIDGALQRLQFRLVALLEGVHAGRDESVHIGETPRSDLRLDETGRFFGQVCGNKRARHEGLRLGPVT